MYNHLDWSEEGNCETKIEEEWTEDKTKKQIYEDVEQTLNLLESFCTPEI